MCCGFIIEGRCRKKLYTLSTFPFKMAVLSVRTFIFIIILIICIAFVGCEQDTLNNQIQEPLKKDIRIDPASTSNNMFIENQSNLNESPSNLVISADVPLKEKIIYINTLTPLKLKFFVNDFNNKTEYSIIINVLDYYTLQAIRILQQWNPNIKVLNYNSLDELDLKETNLVLMGYECNNSVTLNVIDENLCSEKINGNKRLIEFYEETNRKILVIIGATNFGLLESVEVLNSNNIVNLSEKLTVIIDETTYEKIQLPKKIQEVLNKLQTILDVAEEYENKWGTKGTHGIRGSYFRAVQEDISNEYIIFTEEQKEMLIELDLSTLAIKGDKLVEKKKEVMQEARKMKAIIPSVILSIKLDEHTIKMETLNKYKEILENAENRKSQFDKVLFEYEEMKEEIEMPWIKVRQIVANARDGTIMVHIE